MSRQTIETQLKEAIAREPRIFVVKDLQAVTEADRLREDVGLDSVGLLYLVLAVEEQFDLDIDDAEEVAEHFRTWGDLLTFIEDQGR